jgi:hypothetical protein
LRIEEIKNKNFMQTDFDKTIDKLLRAHGAQAARERGARAAQRLAPPSNAAADEFHLDADALAAFVENALPAAARALYTAHLADCPACRQLAAITAANFTAVSSETTSEKSQVPSRTSQIEEVNRQSAVNNLSNPQSAIQRWFAAIFAPSFMRYAVPIVIIGAVGVVSFIALRSSQRNSTKDISFVATQNQDEQTSRPSAAISSSTDKTETQNSSLAASNQNASVGRVGKNGAGDADTAKPSTSETAGGTSREFSDAARKSEEQKALNVSNNPPPAPLPPPPQSASANAVSTIRRNKSANVSEDEPARVEQRQQNETRAQAVNGERSETESRKAEQTPSAVSGSVDNLTNLAPNAEASANRETTARARRSATLAKKADAANKDKAARDDAPTAKPAPVTTREVAGHHFRREGGAWIDSVYNSQRIINVARGSEQFRALAADEPSIRQIAEELAGEVIVVLSGRAYRIR